LTKRPEDSLAKVKGQYGRGGRQVSSPRDKAKAQQGKLESVSQFEVTEDRSGRKEWHSWVMGERGMK